MKNLMLTMLLLTAFASAVFAQEDTPTQCFRAVLGYGERVQVALDRQALATACNTIRTINSLTCVNSSLNYMITNMVAGDLNKTIIDCSKNSIPLYLFEGPQG